jgi:hypothetical protein
VISVSFITSLFNYGIGLYMSEITIKDALDYFKFEIAETNKSIIVGTFPRLWLMYSFLVGCIITIYTNNNLAPLAIIGVLITSAGISIIVYKGTKQRFILDGINGICILIIRDKITIDGAFIQYHKLYRTSLWEFAKQRGELTRTS